MSHPCPCCTGKSVVGAPAWTVLCDECLYRANRMQPCVEHERVRPLGANLSSQALLRWGPAH